MKTCEVYKVIRYFNYFTRTKMYSFASDLLAPIYELEYKIGKRTIPKMGGIFVFKNEECARQFAINNQNVSTRGILSYSVRILKGIAENPIARKTVCFTSEADLRYTLWQRARNGNKKAESLSVPPKSLEDLFNIYWDCIKNKKKQIIPNFPAPNGTLVCDAFTPTEMLEQAKDS